MISLADATFTFRKSCRFVKLSLLYQPELSDKRKRAAKSETEITPPPSHPHPLALPAKGLETYSSSIRLPALKPKRNST